MSISINALNAYKNALAQTKKIDGRVDAAFKTPGKDEGGAFMDALENSLGRVNQLQAQKVDMVQSFASGETQNVHELMIQLQKTSLAMDMTTAVRGKVMEAYRELTKMSF